MITVEEIIEKRRTELKAMIDKQLEEEQAMLKNSVDKEINDLYNTLEASKSIYINAFGFLELVGKNFIYRTTVDPRPFGLRVYDSITSQLSLNGWNVLSFNPDKSLVDKPFHVTIILEPVTDKKESE
jgi:nucleoid DNA-binding protein